MAREILYLGSALSSILKDANANFYELYGTVANLQTMLEDGAQSALVYLEAGDLISGIREGKDDSGDDISLTVGDEIYVIDDTTPDFWVSKIVDVNDENYEEKLPATDVNGNYIWGGPGETYTLGCYQITVSKSREIALEDYVAIASLVVEDISHTIQYDESKDEESKSKAPSVYAVRNAIAKLKTAYETAIGESKTNLEGQIASAKSDLESQISNIESSLDGKIDQIHEHADFVTLEEMVEEYSEGNIGKIQNITFNGNPAVIDETTHTAAITFTLDPLTSGYSEFIEATDDAWTPNFSHTLSDGETTNTYGAALKVNSGTTALEMVNEDGESVVTQNILVEESGQYYIYMCTNEPIKCRLRQLSGFSTGEGSGDTSALEQRIVNLENRKLYIHEHYITMENDDFDVESGGSTYDSSSLYMKLYYCDIYQSTPTTWSTFIQGAAFLKHADTVKIPSASGYIKLKSSGGTGCIMCPIVGAYFVNAEVLHIECINHFEEGENNSDTYLDIVISSTRFNTPNITEHTVRSMLIQ